MVVTIAIAPGLALTVATTAAICDWRSGQIPNWLTLPPTMIAPFAYGLGLGPRHALQCVLAILVSGLVPYLLFRRRAMGGGDVKLFGALGAITGFDPFAGLEIQLGALGVATVLGLGMLAWQGVLLRGLWSAFAMLLNRLLPRRWRFAVGTEMLTPIRMGGAILVATAVFALPHLALAWSRL
jgi:prepilin peptidase CpaA